MTEDQNITKTELVPVSSLIQDPANVRVHSSRNLESIKGSMARFGQRTPIVVGKNNVVLAGNGRLEAAKQMGWEEIWIVRAEDLEGSEATAFTLADNRTAELAEWNFEGLSGLLKELDNEDFNLSELGWDEHELEPLLQGEFKPPDIDEDFDMEEDEEEEDDSGFADERAVKFTESNWELIEKAVGKLRSKTENEELSRQDAIALICNNWLEEN